ncbi:hypothetical protein SSX86_023849 [Deinandra increscens subsp. villosa]|uniref:Uncharacterized protein n=1 Tax=Deinandra increscens subsp. villosa TaxID=3103831 RepID=A0AAP0GN74_9ASTR
MQISISMSINLQEAEREDKLDSTVAQNIGLQSFGTSTSKDRVLTDPISEEQPSSPGEINNNKELKEVESNPTIDSTNEKEKATMKLDSSLEAEAKKTTPVKKLKLKPPPPSKMQQNPPGQSKNKKDLVLGDTVKEDKEEKNVGEKESKKTSHIKKLKLFKTPSNEEKQVSPVQSKKNKESEDVADVEEEKKKGENLESEVEKLAKDANPTDSMLKKDLKMKKKPEIQVISKEATAAIEGKKKADSKNDDNIGRNQKKQENKESKSKIQNKDAPSLKKEQNKKENEKKEVAKAKNSDDDFQVPKKESKDKKETGNVVKGRKKAILARKVKKKAEQPKKKVKKISSPDVEHENEERAYVAYSGDKLQCRTCVGKFVTMLEGLSQEQKTAIENIGFGSVLSFSFQMVPTGLGFWLVKIYDPKNNTLNIGTEKISVTPLEVSEILGIPMGKELVPAKERPRDTTDDVLAEFKG